ncbi:MAG: hypothetical protein KDJ78_02225 [Rhodobacteraceae bacterium]|nr:hypothetical protein [Paracoccaceae bacterium]MCB1402248.1 hypothetical protein [Paracoccaceae bacterium]
MMTEAQSTIDKANAAHQRGMQMPRLLDYGMDFADATALFAPTSADEAWDLAAEQLGRARLEKADRAEEAGQTATAAEERRRAIAALVLAQMAFNFDTPRKRQLYRDLVATCHALGRVSDLPFRRCETPFGGKRLVGWLLRPPAARADGTVILFGGQTGWGVAYLPVAHALARRNLAHCSSRGRDRARPGSGKASTSTSTWIPPTAPGST